jgi:hypothetical protein
MIDKENYRARCNMLLHALIGNKELVEQWWKGENKAFFPETPEQVFEHSPNIIYAYLMRGAEGDW